MVAIDLVTIETFAQIRYEARREEMAELPWS